MHQPALDIEALLDLHRTTFGDTRMDATDDDKVDDEPDGTDDDKVDDERDGTDDDKVDDEPAGKDALGDKGKQALDRMKQTAKTERAKRRELEAELAKLKAPK